MSDMFYNKIAGKKLAKVKKTKKLSKEEAIRAEANKIAFESAERAVELHQASEVIEDHFKGIFKQLNKVYNNFDLKDANLKDSPGRVSRAWIEMLSGLGLKGEKAFSTSFPSEKYDQIIVLSNINYASICSHHFLPFTGKVSIGYLPNQKKGKVCGVSKLARVVDVYAKRPQLQERFCNNILSAIEKALDPAGAIVVTTGKHHCMVCRGVEEFNTDMITSAVSGVFLEQSMKHEFFELLKLHKSKNE